MKFVKEITHRVANNHKLTNNAHLDGKKSKFATRKRKKLFLNSCLYGFTPVIKGRGPFQNDSIFISCDFQPLELFQMGHTAYQIQARTPRNVKSVNRISLNTCNFRNLL